MNNSFGIGKSGRGAKSVYIPVLTGDVFDFIVECLDFFAVLPKISIGVSYILISMIFEFEISFATFRYFNLR